MRLKMTDEQAKDAEFVSVKTPPNPDEIVFLFYPAGNKGWARHKGRITKDGERFQCVGSCLRSCAGVSSKDLKNPFSFWMRVPEELL
jgi:hypothetical protein